MGLLSRAEEIASDLLRKHYLEAPLSEDALLELADRLGVKVKALPDDWAGDSFRAGRYIMLERGLSRGERLWTLAHELGHYCLHLVSDDDGLDRTHTWQQEREADDFAGALLLGWGPIGSDADELVCSSDLPAGKVREWLARRGVSVAWR